MLKYTFVILFIAVYAHFVSFYVINITTDIIAQQKDYKYLLPLQFVLQIFSLFGLIIVASCIMLNVFCISIQT